jgi:hypothetical protein
MRGRSGRTVLRGGTAMIAVVVGWLTVGLAYADHLPWMRPYKSTDDGSCCGDADCIPATVALGQDGEVIVNGVPLRLPPGSVHLPPDDVETGWWCYHGDAPCQPPLPEISDACARCVFVRGRPRNLYLRRLSRLHPGADLSDGTAMTASLWVNRVPAQTSPRQTLLGKSKTRKRNLAWNI